MRSLSSSIILAPRHSGRAAEGREARNRWPLSVDMDPGLAAARRPGMTEWFADQHHSCLVGLRPRDASPTGRCGTGASVTLAAAPGRLAESSRNGCCPPPDLPLLR